jgi:hypothetical protein
MKRSNGQQIFAVLIVCLLALICYAAAYTFTPKVTIRKVSSSQTSLFPYQCIDTMKVSRDRARDQSVTQPVIAEEVRIIKSLGANCVALGTPYDEEFVPFLHLWVAEARKAGLSVWFRGNHSSWEGWFSYPDDQTPDKHIEQTVRFIRSHPDLFADGDMFSANVEPENGNPFHPVDSDEKRERLRQYLIKEQTLVKRAFTAIRKDVLTSRISMSGGVAKSVLDEKTLLALDNTVTIDHYVHTPEEMTDYITYFTESGTNRIVIGEFGAPIPDLNGEMDDTTQAAFVDHLLWELFLARKHVDAINYWTLTESSTALLSEDMNPKPVSEILKKYYLPEEILMTVTDTKGTPLPDARITIKKTGMQLTTDASGQVRILLPQGSYRLLVTDPRGMHAVVKLHSSGNETLRIHVRFPESALSHPDFTGFLRRRD